MKTLIRKILLGCALFGAIQTANAQCPNDNALWGDITPTYDNQNSSWASITGVWGGDYYTVNVCAGATYTFTMCDNALVTYDAVMTLYNNTGGPALAFNDDHCGLLPQITWEATFTGTVRVLIDEFGCLANAGPGMTLACYINSDCGTTAAPIGQVFGCNADVGTYTYTLNGVAFNPATEPAVLCAGNAANCISVTSNQDWIQAPACDNNNFEVSEIMYAIYTCPPPATPDPNVDACYSGFLWSGQDYNQCGDAGIAGIIGSSNYWFIPITADDSDNGGDPNGVINFDQDGDGCYDTGTPIEIWEVNPITSGAVDVNCYNGVISFQVLGGQPEADGSNYVITNNANGTVVTGATTDGGYVILNGLNNGDAYNITINDNVGSCPITVSGTYTACPCPTLDFTYTSPVQCDDPTQTLVADQGAMAPGESITPCYYVQVIPSNAQAGNTIEFFENAVSLGTLNVTPNTNYSGFASYIDPTQNNTFQLCDAAAGTNMQYYVIDCHSGNVITSGTWIADGSACQTVTVTPPSTNVNGTSSWSGTGITVSTNWGAAVFDPGVAGAGTHTITYTWDNGAGCSGTATNNIVVQDAVPPTLTCPGNITVNNDAGNCSAVVNTPNPGLTDNCTSLTLTWALTGATTGTSPGTGVNYVGSQTFNVGTTTVTYTATDGANTVTCSYTVTVNDTENPVISCSGFAATFPADAGQCYFTLPGALSPVSMTDNCSTALTYAITGATTGSGAGNVPLGTQLNVGVNTITFTATDPAGNTATCTETITVEDTQLPTITCPGNQTGTVNASCNFALPDYTGLATANDNCSVTVTQSPAIGTNVGTGTTTITLTATDAAGLTASCTFDVVVTDITAPTISCPGNQTPNFDANCEYVLLDYTALATANDNCPGVTVTQSPAVGTVITGTTSVTLTATDAAGLTATCNFDVIPADNTAPIASCQNITVNLDATGNATITTGDIDNGSTDNCGIASMSLDVTAFTCADIGANTVTLTVTDAAGNSDNCTATVTIVDPNVPTADAGPDDAICSGDTYTLAAISGGSATSGSWTTSGDGGFSANNDPNAVYTPGAGDIAAGTVTLTWTTDLSPCTDDSDDMVLTINETPTFTVSFGSDPSACGATDGTIIISGLNPNSTYDNLTYNDGTGTIVVGSFTTDGSGEFVITGLGAGGYSNFIVTLGPCTHTENTPIALSDPSAPTFTVAIQTHPSTCGGNDGEIIISGLIPNTSYDITYDGPSGTIVIGTITTDASGNYVITGLSAGNHSNFVVDFVGCVSSDNTVLTLNDPTPEVPVAVFTSDPTSCGGTDGSITLTGLTPNTTYNFSYDDGTGTIVVGSITTDGAGDYLLTGLAADTYTNFSVTAANNCTGTDVNSITLTDPNAPTFTASFVSDPTTCGGADGVIEICGLTPSTLYDNLDYDDGTGTINFGSFTTDAAGCFQITGLSQDSYSNFMVTLAGCTGTDANSIALTDPNAPTFTASFVSDPTTCGGADGVIEICGLTPSTVYDNLDYDNGTGTINHGSFTTDAAGCFQITGLSQDSYSNFMVTLAGCSGTDANSIALTDPNAPTFTASFVSDPTACGAADGVIEICGLTPSTIYDNLDYDDGAGTVNFGSFTTDAAGCFQITGLAQDTYTNFVVTLTGCSGTDANSITLTDPNAPTFTASFVSDPTTCGAADGVIEICGLTPSTLYDNLDYDNGAGTVNFGSFTTDAAGCFQITGLVADTYSNFTVTLSSCVGTDANGITLTDPSITFTVTVTDPTTCGGTDGTITISGLSASTNYDISYDDASGTVNLGTVTSDAAGDYVITGLTAGNYSNILVQLGACSGSDAGPYVLTDPAAPAAPIAGVDATYCIGDPVLDLTATAGSGGTLTWYSDPTPSGVLGTGATYTPSTATGTTVYYVTETANGCESTTSSVTITIESCVVLELIIPTGFTPDGDGVNDVWDIQNINALYPNCVVRVFNRWGNILFESNGYQTPWDGRHNGKDLPTGSYFFTIDFGDSSMTPESGSVTIIR